MNLALRCYPRDWKARHGEEAAQLALLLAEDGVPTASIALSYLGGALRERLAPFVRRQWRTRAAALLAAGSIAITSLAMSTSPAPAAAVGVVRVGVTHRSAAVSELKSAFRAHHFAVAVRQVPAPANEVGSIVGAFVTGPPSPSRSVIGEVQGPVRERDDGLRSGPRYPGQFRREGDRARGPSDLLGYGHGAKASGRPDVTCIKEERNG